MYGHPGMNLCVGAAFLVYGPKLPGRPLTHVPGGSRHPTHTGNSTVNGDQQGHLTKAKFS